MFLYYILIVDIINIIDYYIGIPISDFQLLMLHSIITGISLFIILFLYLKIKRKWVVNKKHIKVLKKYILKILYRIYLKNSHRNLYQKYLVCLI